MSTVLAGCVRFVIQKDDQDIQQHTEEVYQVNQRGKVYQGQGMQGLSLSVVQISTEVPFLHDPTEGFRKLWNES